MVAVEDIGGKEERQHADNAPFADDTQTLLDGTRNGVLLGLNSLVELDESDARRRANENTQHPANDHDDHESDVCRVGHSAGLGVEVEAKRSQRANTASEVENNPVGRVSTLKVICCEGRFRWSLPEDSNSTALLGLRHIRNHYASLDDPDERGTDTKNGTRGNNEGAVLVVVEVQQATGVESIRPASDEEAVPWSEP